MFVKPNTPVSRKASASRASLPLGTGLTDGEAAVLRLLGLDTTSSMDTSGRALRSCVLRLNNELGVVTQRCTDLQSELNQEYDVRRREAVSYTHLTLPTKRIV